MTSPRNGARMGRLAEQRAQRRRLLRRGLVGGVAVLVLVVAAVVVPKVLGGDSNKPTVDAARRTQKTVLMVVRDATGAGVAGALLADDRASGDGAVILLPPQVLVTVPGSGNSTLGASLVNGSLERTRAAVEDLMGVTIDAAWSLTPPAFAQLVDSEGGVRATVDVPVLSGRTVLLQPGASRLTGIQALQFATYLAPGEQEQTRLARLQTVLDAVVQALPKDVTALVGSLGAAATSTAPAAVVAGVLSGLKLDDEQDNLQYRSLPVIRVDAGNDDVRFRLDRDANILMVDELLAQSVPVGARSEGNRILVLNGVGTPGLGESVRAKLVPAGFVYVGSRNADSFNQCCTQVLVKESTTEAGALGARVAKALGLPGASVKSSNQIGTIADVVVIIGKDFTPGK